MQQIRITRTSQLDNVLASLKERYPLLSEAEIIKMSLSKQYYQETRQEQPREYFQDPTQRFTKSEWKKKFAVFEQIRERITPENEEQLDNTIDRAVREVRAEKAQSI